MIAKPSVELSTIMLSGSIIYICTHGIKSNLIIKQLLVFLIKILLLIHINFPFPTQFLSLFFQVFTHIQDAWQHIQYFLLFCVRVELWEFLHDICNQYLALLYWDSYFLLLFFATIRFKISISLIYTLILKHMSFLMRFHSFSVHIMLDIHNFGKHFYQPT